MGVTRTPLSIFTGQKMQIRCVSKSYGAIRPGMVDGFDFTPTLSMQRIPEFDNPVDALVYTTYDGGGGKLSYSLNNQGQIQALIMDRDPAVEEIVVNQSIMQPFTVFANLKGADGKIKGSLLLRDCTPTGNPFTSVVKEGAKQELTFEFLNAYQFVGLGILHTRARSATGPTTAPEITSLGTTTTGGLLEPDTYYVRITGVTADGETNGGNEQSIEVPAGTSTNIITVTHPAIAGSITAYNIYVSNRSNGERYIVQSSSGTTEDITALPSTTAAECPNNNTTGAPQVTGDKEFVSQAVTLDTAAFKIPQTGLDYAAILKNGSIIATPDNEATQDDFWFNDAGTTFNVRNAPAAIDYYDIFSLYQPS